MVKKYDILWLLVLISGCSPIAKNLIPENQILLIPVQQSYEFRESLQTIWAIVKQIADNEKSCSPYIVSQEDALLSWCEAVHNWQDLSTDTITLGGYPVEQPGKNDLLFNTGKGFSLTTVWIEETDEGCRVHIRRVMRGFYTLTLVGHSRGEYERKMIAKIYSALNNKLLGIDDEN